MQRERGRRDDLECSRVKRGSLGITSHHVLLLCYVGVLYVGAHAHCMRPITLAPQTEVVGSTLEFLYVTARVGLDLNCPNGVAPSGAHRANEGS